MPADTPAKTRSPMQKALHKLGLKRDIDLALHLPLRYEDETHVITLREAREGESVQIEGSIVSCEVQTRGRRQLLVTLDDGTDTCVLRFFSFYPAQQKNLAVGKRVRARGEIKGGFMGWAMMHPLIKPADIELPTALTPVYSTSAGLPQAYLRKAVASGLARADLSETLPAAALHDHRPPELPLWSLRDALAFLHHPTPDVALATLENHSHGAWQRLKAEELLAQQLTQLQSKREHDALYAPALQTSPQAHHLRDKLLSTLPFHLTSAQRRVCEEIAQDLAKPTPMHRLLQGDVGSGKTVVAAVAAAICIDAGWQCALMVPTEILAAQHFTKLIAWLEPLGVGVAWLTGGQKVKERREALARIASGEAGLIVGTHAVIQDKVQFKNLALAIIDEQHRFGVAQRLALRDKMTANAHSETIPPSSPSAHQCTDNDSEIALMQEPHLLMMTATPIPRTLAMSYYADLEVSTIDELPPGRTPIVTKLVADSRRHEVVRRIHQQLAQGRQVYWVCPLIEESETVDLTNATATHAELSAALPGIHVGLLHSRLLTQEKKEIMAQFVTGQMQVLVSTTVIEVGVDVPNASLMVIEHAERFGLSQLHQLRGRVGRGSAASACVLLYSLGDSGKLGEAARARLKAMAESHDGFEIARRDLDIRGPGEFLGARQSGAALLRFADLTLDGAWLDWARALAPHFLDQYPSLAERHVTRWLGTKSEYLKA